MAVTACSLLPALAVKLWFGGMLVGVDIITALMTVTVCDAVVQRRTLWREDLSSWVSAAIIVLALPAGAPWYVNVFAIGLALGLGKYAFGGQGQNVFNPAMVGYAAALVAFPWLFTFQALPIGPWDMDTAALKFSGSSTVDAYTGATALEAARHGSEHPAEGGPYQRWFAVAVGCGFAWLLMLKLIAWRTTAGFVVTLGVLGVLGDGLGLAQASWSAQMLNAGSILGATYVVTDPVTMPARSGRQWAYGSLIALITMAIRWWGGYPDGLAFAVLLVNALIL